MTHFNVDYASLGGQAKIDKALADIKAYIGKDRFETMILVADRDGEDAVRHSFDLLLGVSGYPVEAFVRAYVREQGGTDA